MQKINNQIHSEKKLQLKNSSFSQLPPVIILTEEARTEVAMLGNQDVNYSLIDAVRKGQLERARKLIHSNNHVSSINLIILACKHNKVKILEYLLGINCKILSNSCIGVRETTILPDDEDETCHNAFYYAIRSGNVELLDILISKWPGNYFAVHFRELDEILSRAYEELKLKNVSLSEEIEIYVENKLINLRFFSSSSDMNQNGKRYIYNPSERIDLVLQNICLLKAEYSNAEKIDERFLFITKFVAQNIHILKRQLKSTYERLPWEEIEFCLISFVSSYIKRQEINLFYNATLNKSKILIHLENFAKKLKEEKDILNEGDIDKLANLPKLKREKVVAKIVCNYPQFEELYSDHQQIRDIHSLEKISDYIKLALSADPKQREGQLIITRVLQAIGEYLKNTLESPKLSNTVSELLLLSLPRNTREVLIDLRNSLSHAFSLSKRTEIEEYTDVNFFIGVQNDTKRIDNVIADILCNNKIKIIRILLTKITSSESLEEIKEVAAILSNVELDGMITESFEEMEHNKLENLIKKLSNILTAKTNYENELFTKIESMINSVKTKSKNIRTDYVKTFVSFKTLFEVFLKEKNIDHNAIREMKFRANRILENIPFQIEHCNLKEIVELLMEISRSARSRIMDDHLHEVKRLTYEILFMALNETGDLKWIEELRNKLNEKGSCIPKCKQRKVYKITQEKYNNHLELKLSELEGILRKNALSDKLTEKLPSYKRNKKLQAIVEMLVLDIMSLLGMSERFLENNILFLDENTPLLTGKCLRNHLAHDNTLLDVLSSDPSIAVILNAEKLISENIIHSKHKIGKSISDDPPKLKDKYDQNLLTITWHAKMFSALEEGKLEDLKNYLRKGADINARNIHSSTALHFAASGPCLDVIKFVIDQKLDPNIKDINGQSPLHIAASHGRKNIVDFLVREAGVYVDDPDNSGKTSLHIAAENGHKDAVEILLKNNANTNTKDMIGYSPLHYAILNNQIDAAKIMLEKEVNVDINETMGGFTPLHISAECGHLELVNFLLQNRAEVNARNDRDWTPLHAAAFNGHLEVVKLLLTKGANVNARVINGCTPLQYAVENGHEMIAIILLKHGANVNAMNKFNCTPLHHAAKNGFEEIVKYLLKNKANASIATLEGTTPLHLSVQSCHLKIVATLLEHGINIHAKDKNNATPLHYAAESGHKAVTEVLINNGAKINDKAKNDITPLHAASLKGNTDIIELLVRNKAEVRAQDIDGGTPLHAAAMHGSYDAIHLLLKNGAEVNDRNNSGMTPIYLAALKGHVEAVILLIKNRADVNVRANYGFTPLHAAVVGGHKDVVNLLIKNKAKVNEKGIADCTPLHLAVEAGLKEVVEILAANGANVNVRSNNLTPLLYAIKHNHKEIVEVLVENGANVNTSDMPLSLAVTAGYRDVVDILLKHKAFINVKGPEDLTPLHYAAMRGHKEIVSDLIASGADVDAMTIDYTTPLYFAAAEGHEEVAEVLIANKANVNVVNVEGTPLHIAAGRGHVDVVEVLLNNGAKINDKDNIGRTPLELAVSHGSASHLQVVKKLLQHKIMDVNAKGNDGYTLLHIASQEDNLEMVKFLVDEGCNINARNSSGSKPVHIAAREGHKDIVEFFLSNGLNINESGAYSQTLLHYAAMKGHLDVVSYLIVQGADVNSKDTNGCSPMHIAAVFGFKDVIEVLLRNGAIFNAVDKDYRSPLEITNKKDVINLLAPTKELFESVKRNNSSEVENCIKIGAYVNAKSTDCGTVLHYTAWKGYDRMVKILLQNGANPNLAGNKGFTPIHYAAKFSHLKIVKTLLSYGAVYNAVSDSGKTPSKFSVDRDINSLFKLISDSFSKVKDGDAKVINMLNKIKDIDTVKAVLGARNRENKSLIVAAIHSNFSKVEQLKQIFQIDVSAQIHSASVFLIQDNYQKALSIFRSVFERRKEILGPDNPGTLDIQTYIAKVLYKQGIYQEALSMFEEIFLKQKDILGLNDKDTLSTRSMIALVLHNLGQDEKALCIFQEVCQRQKEMLGLNHSDTLDTQFHMALVLDRLGKHDEALTINMAVFEKLNETLGTNDPATVRAKNNIGLVLASQGKYEESLKIYRQVFESKKTILGINHVDTLRTLYNIAGVLFNQNKHQEALKAFQQVLDLQKKVLRQNHPETLNTQYNIANVFFAQRKFNSALKVYRECFDQRKAVFGPNHPSILDISKE